MRITSFLRNALKKHFQQKIAFSGPITVSEYMKTCLYSPEYGFYSKNPLGKHGHFITSPEITSLFGEILGVWAAKHWESIGCPSPITYIELGPGRGLMCSDILRAFLRATDLSFRDVSIKLVENSRELQRLQKDRLNTFFKNSELDVQWVENVLSCSVDSPFFLFANEFFDAIPVHIFNRVTTKFREVLVDVDSSGNLSLIKSPGITASLSLVPDIFNECNHLELSFESGVMMLHLAKLLNEQTGACLVIDYGYDDVQSSCDSFRAFKSHKQVNPLEEPGSCDLTADVNFAFLKHLLNTDNDNPVDMFGLVEQGDFLFQMGIQHRLKDALEACKTQKQAEELFNAFKSITSPDHMGSKFKVFCMQSKGSCEPAGFQTETE